MADNVTCTVCGGKDFSKEAGYFYCNECQTQTQDLREQELDLDDAFIGTRTSKINVKSQTSTSKTSKCILTSWEAHNYVLAGLTEELISFGAPDELKEITYLLWMAYLRKIKILSSPSGKYQKPKLGLAFARRDAQIVYGHLALKRKSRAKLKHEGKNSIQ